MTEEQCYDVHAFRNATHVITCWQPTPEERAIIAAGGPVWLGVYGGGMPPVFLVATSPFMEVFDNDLNKDTDKY